MGTKKDIGQAFKERISEFNDTPNNAVWEQIEVELNKDKKKDRLIIIWFKYGAIALALFMLVFLNRDHFIDFKSKITFDKNNIESIEHNTNTTTNSSTNLYKQSSSNAIKEQTILNKKKDSINRSSTEKLPKLNTTSPHQTQSINSNRKRNTFDVMSSSTKTKKNNNIDTNLKSEYSDEIINKYSDNTSNDSKKTQKEISLLSKLTDSDNSNKELVKHQENQSEENDDEIELKQKNKDSITNHPKESKWSVFPNVSMIYYDGFKKSFTNQITTNYGIYFNYLSSKKINIRLGVNKLQLQQTFTENNISRKQSIDYIEIPLEFKYNITQHKIQPYFIAGVSYLFINDAELTIIQENNSGSTYSNKNTFAKSTISFNTGLGLQTKINNRFYFNIESLVKYHFEPYSESVDFHPYTISILGGIEYKF